MPGPIRKVFVCKEHGPVYGTYCKLCKTLQYTERRKKGLVVHKLREGSGPKPSDPTPLAIKFRAGRVRRNRGDDYRGVQQ